MVYNQEKKLQKISINKNGYPAAAAALKRVTLQDNPKAEEIVRAIISRVREEGDSALLELGRKFDSSSLDALEVSVKEWDSACARVEAEMCSAMERAAENIRIFHEKQKRPSWISTEDGRVVGQIIRPLDRVGIYVPGGTAVYPSSVLMSAIPAKVAGVPDMVICTPCGKDGQISALVLYAARLAGVKRVFRVGGAQAIAAMALGTETIPRVDKIVGPGNVYVNIAKKLLWGEVDIDMLAGPSEVCVVADETANPAYAASDILAQAEHDVECAAYLITPSEEIADAVEAELEKQLALQPRKDILCKALDDHGAIIIAESMKQTIELANLCAPEHLALMTQDPYALLGSIRNAGAVLMGRFSPQTLGDYFAGPSHTLPTSGTARFASPLHVDTFLKKSSFISYTQDALNDAADVLVRFAEAEGFHAHASAVTIRTQDGK
jgi:histidinol dehydrogenase